MEHRRQATAKEIDWLGPGTRGDVCRVPGGDRATVVRARGGPEEPESAASTIQA
jgi:hypothetical protein